MIVEPQLPRRPSTETISGFVRVQRAIYGWKQQTLASKAGVSLSTVQRVERAETVADESLEKLALALNQERGAFTAPRAPIPEEEAIANVASFFAEFNEMIPVDVAPLRTENQIRALCHTMLCFVTHDLGEDAEVDVDTLKEWLDLTSFSRARDGVFFGPKHERDFSIRRMYGDVLRYVEELEKNHKAVCLAGTYQAQSNMPGEGEIVVGLVAVRSREHNPAASKIKCLYAPKEADMKGAMRAFFGQDD